jgi:uncharacterized protein YndB with AHSA1/START domain
MGWAHAGGSRMIEVERVIDATPDVVFDVLADGWVYAAWVVGASRVRSVDAGWPQQGTRIHHSVGAWPLLVHDTTHVASSQPPHRLELDARVWPVGEAKVIFELAPEAMNRCRVRMIEDATKGPMRVVPYPLRNLAISPRNVETLRRLAYLAEGREGRRGSDADQDADEVAGEDSEPGAG